MLTREKVIKAIETMPAGSFENIDVLLESLVLWNKIERGLKDIEDGNVLSNEEVEKKQLYGSAKMVKRSTRQPQRNKTIYFTIRLTTHNG